MLDCRRIFAEKQEAVAGALKLASSNVAVAPVDNVQAGGSTANVLSSGLKPGMLGVYEVQIQLSTSLTTNPNTQLYMAQNVFTSNIVTIPVVDPAVQTPVPAQ